MAHVILVGLPGSGKTTVGRRVAKRLRRNFVDLDIEIERTIGKKVAEIFQSEGEEAFREYEARASLAIAAEPPAVVAPGGGWATNSLARAHLHGRGRIIYLRVDGQVALDRMGRRVALRPLLVAGDAAARMADLAERRGPIYEACADIVIDTSRLTRDEVVDAIVESVRAAERIQGTQL